MKIFFCFVALLIAGVCGMADTDFRLVRSFGGSGVFGIYTNAPMNFENKGPMSICVDGQDRLLVADTYANRVKVFDATGEFQFQFFIPGMAPSLEHNEWLYQSNSITADDSTIYVGIPHYVKCYNYSGGFIRQFSYTTPATWTPLDIAINSTDGLLYVLGGRMAYDFGGDVTAMGTHVVVFNSSGGVVRYFPVDVGLQNYAYSHRQISIDGNNNLWVTRSTNGQYAAGKAYARIYTTTGSVVGEVAIGNRSASNAFAVSTGEPLKKYLFTGASAFQLNPGARLANNYAMQLAVTGDTVSQLIKSNTIDFAFDYNNRLLYHLSLGGTISVYEAIANVTVVAAPIDRRLGIQHLIVLDNGTLTYRRKVVGTGRPWSTPVTVASGDINGPDLMINADRSMVVKYETAAGVIVTVTTTDGGRTWVT